MSRTSDTSFFRCKYCGGWLMAKDSVQAIVHVVPECEDFAAHMKKHAPAVVVGITEDGEIVSPETLRGVRPS